MTNIDEKAVISTQIRELHQLNKHLWAKYSSAQSNNNEYLTALNYTQTAESAYIALLKLFDRVNQDATMTQMTLIEKLTDHLNTSRITKEVGSERH